MSYSDLTLVCRDCNSRFMFTAGEQNYYSQHGLQHQPTRCPNCRQARKSNQDAGGDGRGAENAGPRQLYEVICSSCKRTALVPFKPDPSKPVYCPECYDDHRGGRMFGSPAGYRSNTRF